MLSVIAEDNLTAYITCLGQLWSELWYYVGVDVVTASGDIIRTGTRARKTSAGYDLTCTKSGWRI